MHSLYQRIAVGLLQSCVVAAPLFLLSTRPAAAVEPAACRAASSISLDARLAAKADEGSTSLRRFVARTTTIYALDVPTALARADRFRQAHDACVTAVASR